MSTRSALFPAAIQPSVISLFSSTGSDPLSLFSVCIDKSLPSDSFVHFLHDRLSGPTPSAPKALLRLPERDRRDDRDPHTRGRELDQTVLHIQSPTLPTTYIQCPPITRSSSTSSSTSSAGTGASAGSSVLGIKLPRMHLQVRNLGKEWSFEVGIVDHVGREGIIRFSVFQKKPRLRVRRDGLPLLHLPLSFPSHSTHLLTTWSTITVYFPSLLPYFTSPHLLDPDRPAQPNPSQRAGPSLISSDRAVVPGTALPAGTFAYVSYVRVYANCRLRRIWFGDGGPSQKVPWEFELYAVD